MFYKIQQRIVQSLSRNDKIKYYKQRFHQQSKPIKHNNFSKKVTALHGTFNNRVKNLLFNQKKYHEALIRQTRRKLNYSIFENRELVLKMLTKK